MIRSHGRRRLVGVSLLALSGLLISCSSPVGPDAADSPSETTNGDTSPADEGLGTATPDAPTGTQPEEAEQVTSAPAEDAATTSEPPDPRPERCRGMSDEELQERVDRLGEDIEEAMAGYDGEWGFGMVDLDCDIELAVNEDWVGYTASAGKIIPIIAALRAVDDGDLSMASVEGYIELIMEHSYDEEANILNGMVTPEQVQDVLEIAEVSEDTDFEWDWNRGHMPARDLARVWAALVEGDLLDEEQTEYLLNLADGPAIPDHLDTFPIDAELSGWQFGQKAGYWVTGDLPHLLLGAGYLRPDEGPDHPEGHQGITVVLHVEAENPDMSDPQRREVFPLITEYVQPS